MIKVTVTLPPGYPRNDPNYPSKERLEMAYTYLINLPILQRKAQQIEATKEHTNIA